MAKKQNISSPKLGMAKDAHPSQLENTQYSYANNTNVENEIGDFLTLQNEKSNLLANKFYLEYDPINFPNVKRYFKVINTTNDIDSDDTYVFLVEPISGVGQFGVLRNNQATNDLQDVDLDCGDCSHIKELAEPLENLTQVELQSYETLISDACHVFNNEPEKGFMFNVLHPIKKTVIKNEKVGGKTIYFDQVGNPPRYINISNINQYFIGEVPCDDDEQLTCADFDKMRVFKQVNIPHITPTSIELGGNLKMGVYEFLVAYCDVAGNEISEYFSITNPISVFDKNNQILSQPQLADRTNFAIRVDLSFLDKKFQYYKIAVIQTADIQGATRYFIEGVHGINDTTVIYSTEQNKVETSIDNLARVSIKVDEAELVATANNILYHSGIKTKKELNLQPVVNLMGEFVKWQTHIAPENLYENGINSALYLGYTRDEVVPLGIRFLVKGGIETAVFPFIGRTATAEDLEDISLESNDDVQSIINNKIDCVGNLREKRWQFYNTATEDSGFCGGDIETVEVEETSEIQCEVLDVAETTTNTLTISPLETYTDLVSYVNDNKENCADKLTTEICTILTADYSSVKCPLITVTLSGTSGAINVVVNDVTYLLNFSTSLSITASSFITLYASDILTDVGATIVADGNNIIFYDSAPEVTSTNVSGNLATSISSKFNGACSNIVEDSNYSIDAYEVVDEEIEDIYKTFGVDYLNIVPPTNNLMYNLDSSGNTIEDATGFKAAYTPALTSVFQRYPNFTHEDCGYAENIVYNQVVTQNSALAFYNNYYFTTGVVSGDPTALFHSPAKTGCKVASNFYGNLHKGALWYKGQLLGRTEFILDISKQNDNPKSDYFDTISDQRVRISVFKDCTQTTPVFSEIIDLNSGDKFLFKKSGSDLIVTNSNGTPYATITNGWFSTSYLVAIDNRIEATTTATNYAVTPTRGTYTVTMRDTEVKERVIAWTELKFKKTSTLTADCVYDQPVVQSCKAIPYKKGKFAYWESQETYPDNNELYNSSSLIISPSDFSSTEYVSIFENAFAIPNGTGYTWKESPKTEGGEDTPVTDFTCRNIRHFRFPDNIVAPFMTDTKIQGGTNSLIYPLGITIDENLILDFLNIAKNNGLISKKEREDIIGYEIVRGDLSLNRSIIASGLLYDMRKYQQEGKDVDVVNNNYTLYPNYPFNSMRQDVFNRKGTERAESGLFTDSTFGISNNNYTFHSPETDYEAPTLPTELSIQGYMFGQANTQFNEVLDHPKWVMLTDKARDLASLLAGLETILDAAIIMSNASQSMFAGFTTNYGAPFAWATVALAIPNTITNFGKHRYDWLQTFSNLGTPKNFAYYSFGVGKYNYLQTLQTEGSSLRGINTAKYLKEGRYKTINEVTGTRLDINNIDRERSVFLSTGNYEITYPDTYKTFDKDPSVASLTYMSEKGFATSGLSPEIKSNIASPYVNLKNYLPQQHGTIDSIRWLTTGFRGDLLNPTSECLSIFGGDTYISRHTLKRKHPQFLTTAMGQADRTPFNYYFYNNIGRNPRFFVSHGMDTDFTRSSVLFPDIVDVQQMDNYKTSTNYIIPPSKFFLFYYGIPSFLCETRINTNYRYAEKEYERNFYPQVGDVGNWTQEKNVSIKLPNYFFYNKVYSKQVTPLKLRTLSSIFSREISDKQLDMPNGIISSLPDNSENSTYDPWLVYRPLDRFEFPTNYGKLKDLTGIENEAILARFENTSVIYNKVDYTNDDGQNPSRTFLGGTSFFQRRSAGLVNSQLGFGGTQNSQSISCEFGHFHVDARRGQVIHIPPGGQGQEEISSLIQGKPSGMRQWFKEHLPFKMLKSIKNVDIDNNFNGLGITMAYDSRYRRVFITKKDYIPKSNCIEFDSEKGFLLNTTQCSEEPQTPTCPEGYTYNTETESCEKLVLSSICPTGYEYDNGTNTCIKVTNTIADCDCEVSEWSDWSECVDETQYRTRTVISQPQGNGTLCPELIEYEACSTAVPCGGSLSTNGSQGYYEIPFETGSNTGTVTVTLDAQTIPDRFIIMWNNTVVADSLFIGDGLPDTGFETAITTPTTLNKYLYNPTQTTTPPLYFDPNGTINVSYTSSDIANSTGGAGTLRSSGSIGAQIGVVANYPSPTAKASDGTIKLQFTKTSSTPTQAKIIGVGMDSGTAWNLIDISCPT